MYLPDTEAAELRKWLIQRLEALEAVADADVLADFVIALLRTDTEEQQLKKDAYTELEDFLKKNTQTFLDQVFAAVKTKSYLPGYVPAMISAPTPASLPQPIRTGVPIDTNPNISKKRSYNDMQDGTRDPSLVNGNRQIKQPRWGSRARGGRSNGRGSWRDMDAAFDETMDLPQHYAGDPNIPISFPDFPLEQFSDPFTAMASLQAMGFPGLPQLQQTSPAKRKKGRCRDYDTKGFCTRGNACPYQHGEDHLVFPGADEYDPHNPTGSAAASNGHSQANGRGRGRGGRIARGGRSEISHIGPLHDRTATAIVVEHIPEDKFSEEAVREFFSEFGGIEEVTLQSYKRIAIVKYSDHASAQRAYESPKVIFDNRFVKVYWFKSDKPPTSAGKDTTNGNGHPEEIPQEEERPFDKEEFERKSQEAQRKLEEKKAQIKEMAAQREKLQEMAQKQADEKKALLKKLAAKGAASSPEADMTDAKDDTKANDSATVNSNTKALRAKVAELEAEAKSLGIDHNSSAQAWSPRGRGRGRGRGSYRGWEGFGGGASHSGSPRGGRGGFRGWSGGGKYNLDLRTKRVEVAGAEWTSTRDEALRQHLLGVGEYESIETHPDKMDTVVVNFKDRPTAEAFLFGTKEIAGAGKLELSWCNLSAATSGAEAKATEQNGLDKDGDVGMQGMNGSGDMNGANGDVDYDVAEEDDRWR